MPKTSAFLPFRLRHIFRNASLLGPLVPTPNQELEFELPNAIGEFRLNGVFTCLNQTCADPVDPGTGGGSGGDGAACVSNGDCTGGDCEAGSCQGSGGGSGGDACQIDGDCANVATCTDGVCTGTGGGGGGNTCDDGEQVCAVTADCPNNFYCQQGCCLPIIL